MGRSPEVRRAASALSVAIVGLALVLSACSGGETDGGPTPGSGPTGPTSPTGSTAASGPSGPTAPADGVVVGALARLDPQPGREDQLGCALTFQNLPEGRVDVRLETLGLGVGADIRVQVGRQWDDGVVSEGPRADQILIFEAVEGPVRGDHGCRVLGMTGPGGGDIAFGGEILTLDSVAVAPQEVLAFVADFPRAIRRDDRPFLLATMNPAVLDLYGQSACEKMLARGFADPSFALALLRVRSPGDYTYSADGHQVVVPNTWQLEVTASSDQGSSDTWVHYAQTADGLTWFTDCGRPLPSPPG